MRAITTLAAILTGAVLFAGTALGQSAQEVAALSDMQAMSQALELTVVDTTFLTTLENLDDLPAPGDDPGFEFNWINDQGGALVIKPGTGRFEPSRVDLLNRPVGLNWKGPYVNYQTIRIDDELSSYDEGTLLDPWGNPYYLYSPLGLVSPKAESITLEFWGDAFDGYRIVSHGRDGIARSGDDMIWEVPVYGFNYERTQISSARAIAGDAPGRRGAYELLVKGYGFGEVQGTGGIEVDGVPLQSISSWSPTLVSIDLDTLPSPTSTVALTTDLGETSMIDGILVELQTSVQDWRTY